MRKLNEEGRAGCDAVKGSGRKLVAVATAIFAACVITVALLVARNMALEEAGSEMKSEQFDRAARKLTVLANLGDTTAQWLLADLYAFGRGVPKDDDKAIYWSRRAGPMLPSDESVQSVSDAAAPAMYYIGKTYQEGMGVKRDETEARKWFERSAKGGFAKAAEELKRMQNP